MPPKMPARSRVLQNGISKAKQRKKTDYKIRKARNKALELKYGQIMDGQESVVECGSNK